MFSIISNEADIQITKLSANLTEYKLINNHEESSIIQRKIFNGLSILYYPLHSSIPKHQYLCDDRLLAFHCCECGKMQIIQRNETVTVKNESICIHKISPLPPHIFIPDFTVQNYSGISVVLEFQQLDQLPYTIMEEFPPHILNFWMNVNMPSFISIPIHFDLVHILSNLLKEDPMKTNIAYLKIKIIEMILYLEEFLAKNQTSHHQTCGNYYDTIQEVQHYLIANFHQKINIEQLTRKYGISKTLLKETFKKIYGKPIISYLREIRLTKSLALLEDESLSISQIAEAVGYTNQSKFANAFKKHFSITPHEYRKLKNR